MSIFSGLFHSRDTPKTLLLVPDTLSTWAALLRQICDRAQRHADDGSL